MEPDTAISVIFVTLSAVFAALFIRELRGGLRQVALRKNGRRTTGKCVDHTWARDGSVASVIEFTDGTGRTREAFTEFSQRTPVFLGETAEVVYDPLGKAYPSRPGEEWNAGDFFTVPLHFLAAAACTFISFARIF
ncbi:hypothetical protein ACLIYM_18330 [Streptomyces fenghuangensis]